MIAVRPTLLVMSCIFVAACANPVSAVRVDPKTVYGELSQSAVATGKPSTPRAQGTRVGLDCSHGSASDQRLATDERQTDQRLATSDDERQTD